jgi:hypothetical protein
MRSRANRMGVLAAVSVFLWACGGDDGDGDTGGKAGSGGDSGNCPSFKACGGNPEGEWTVDDLCVTNEKQLFAAAINQPACSAALKSVSGVSGSGKYKLGADKNAMSTIVVSGTAEFSFNDACVKALGLGQTAATDCSKVQAEFGKQMSMGVKSATCSASGANCDCTVVSDLSAAGNSSYTVSGNNIMVNGLTQPFCVENGKLTVQTTQSGSTLLFTLTK